MFEICDEVVIMKKPMYAFRETLYVLNDMLINRDKYESEFFDCKCVRNLTDKEFQHIVRSHIEHIELNYQ